MHTHYTTPDAALYRVGPLTPAQALDLVDTLRRRVPFHYQPRIAAELADGALVVFVSERAPHVQTFLTLRRMPNLVELDGEQLPDRAAGSIWLMGGMTIKRWAERLNSNAQPHTNAGRHRATVRRRRIAA